MTENINTWKFNRGIKRAKKRLERRHSEEFTPYRASLRLMCEKYALPEYFEAIRKIEEIEKAEIKYLTYGKREARRRLIMLQAEQEYNNATNCNSLISEKS